MADAQTIPGLSGIQLSAVNGAKICFQSATQLKLRAADPRQVALVEQTGVLFDQARQRILDAANWQEPPSATRDVYKQPFSHLAYCNTPLGASRQLVKVNLGTRFGVEDEYIYTDPASPLRPLEQNGQWPASCARGTKQADVRIRDGARIPGGYAPNNCSAALGSNNDDVWEFQYSCRDADTHICAGNVWRKHSIKGDASPNIYTNHGGSGLSALAGSLRAWEMNTPGQAIEHTLKLTLNAWFLSKTNGGKRWPASVADTGYDAVGGASEYRGSVPDFRMGSLLCLRDDFNINVMPTEAGRRLATAFKHFGAYVCDIHPGNWTDCWINAEDGANLPPTADLGLIFNNLYVVTDNSATTIGGAGARVRAPLPPL